MADYQAIIDAIDAAMLDVISKPVSLTIMGRTKTYRSLDELKRTREYYEKQLAKQSGRTTRTVAEF